MQLRCTVYSYFVAKMLIITITRFGGQVQLTIRQWAGWMILNHWFKDWAQSSHYITSASTSTTTWYLTKHLEQYDEIRWVGLVDHLDSPQQRSHLLMRTRAMVLISSEFHLTRWMHIASFVFWTISQGMQNENSNFKKHFLFCQFIKQIHTFFIVS